MRQQRSRKIIELNRLIEQLPKFITEQGKILEDVGIDQGRGEVEIILCYLLDLDRLNLHLHGPMLINDEVLKKFDLILNRREKREPLQYILEESWFYGRKFFVSPAVMVPTPETELLCEAAIRHVSQTKKQSPRFLDIGVGSGVISVTIAAELKECTILSLDISEDAIEVAKKNAATYKVSEQLEFRTSDLFSAVDGSEKFDLILSNPPYISDEEYKTLPPEVLADPKISLTSGAEGMDAIQQILDNAHKFLKPDGRLMFEIGYNQAELTMEYSQKIDQYKSITILKDLNEIDRIAILSLTA